MLFPPVALATAAAAAAMLLLLLAGLVVRVEVMAAEDVEPAVETDDDSGEDCDSGEVADGEFVTVNLLTLVAVRVLGRSSGCLFWLFLLLVFLFFVLLFL